MSLSHYRFPVDFALKTLKPSEKPKDELTSLHRFIEKVAGRFAVEPPILPPVTTEVGDCKPVTASSTNPMISRPGFYVSSPTSYMVFVQWLRKRGSRLAMQQSGSRTWI